MSEIEIATVRSDADIGAATELVWEFFDFLKGRYPDMLAEIDAFIESQQVAARLADFGAHYNPPAGECLMARRGGAPVGLVMVRPRADGDAELNRMYVRDSARGTGTGRALCNRAIQTARDLGYSAIWLSVLHRHIEAIPLYKSVGFVPCADPEEPQTGDDRVTTMRLDLFPDHGG